ncbi:MAG: hypothetical protein HKN70_13955 [Gammaproteobacteria bacterium]|nr:hypothetical protein [Gammaproteobacteria bacterium]
MTERLDLFSTPILQATPADHERLDAALLKNIAAERARSPGINRSNLGGWHSDTNMAQWGGPASQTLAEFAAATAGGHMSDIEPAGKRQFNWVIEMWANVNQPGDANQVHCHPGCFWSAVYYPDPGGAEIDSGGGELILEDPRYPLAYMGISNLVLKDAKDQPMQSQVAIRPRAGLLVMFPSWLRHSVRPHRGNRERVSIALNLSPVPEQPPRP